MDEQRIRDAYQAYDATGRTRLWDRSNPGYARLAEDRDDRLRHLIARSLPPTPSPTMLDVGCGDGSLIASVIARWPDVRASGVDLLADRIEVARGAAPDATLVLGSADSLPFPDASFDVISAITLFSSIPSPEMETTVAREVARVMRPQGWLIWYDLRIGNPSNKAVHGMSRNRIRNLFPGWAAELTSLTLAPPLARRLGRLTPLGYPALHAVPPLRTHLVGRLQCPR